MGKDWYTTLVVGIFQIFDVVGRSTPRRGRKVAGKLQVMSAEPSCLTGAREDRSFPEEARHSGVDAFGLHSSALASHLRICSCT